MTKTTKWIKTNKALLSLSVFVGAVLIFTAPLVHIEMAKTNPKVDAFETLLEQKISDIDDQVDAIKSSYKDGTITGDEAYQKIVLELLPARKTQLAQNKADLKKVVDSERIFSWKTPRALANGWGVRLPYVFFSLLLTLLILALNAQDKWLKRSFVFLQIACYTIAFYLQVWTFWPSQDLPLRSYRAAIIGICILCAIGTTFLIKFWYSRSDRLRRIIRFLNGVLVSDVIPYVKNEKEYEDEVMWPTLKKVSDDA